MDPNLNQQPPTPEQPQQPLPSVPPQQPYTPHQENPGQTFGIVSIVMIFVFPILGIVFGAMSRSKSKAAGMPAGLGTAGLIINIVLSVVGLLTLILFFFLVVMAANVDTTQEDGSSDFGSSSSSGSHSPISASDVSDFSEVCDGTPISNAAAFGSKQSAIVSSFYQRPDGVSESWLSAYVGFNKPYYLQDSKNYTSVSLTACAKGTKTGSARQCTYQSKTVDYYAALYDVTFYEAKTAKKIGTGSFDESNASCPSFLSYNTETDSAVASPSDAKYEAAIDSFLAQ